MRAWFSELRTPRRTALAPTKPERRLSRPERAGLQPQKPERQLSRPARAGLQPYSVLRSFTGLRLRRAIRFRASTTTEKPMAKYR